MSRLPNPFHSGEGRGQQTPQRPSTPGFLLMTRPPNGANSFGGSNYQSPPANRESFIPFSNIDNNNANLRHTSNHHNSGSSRFNSNRGSGGGYNRFPYQQSPRSPRGQHHGQGYNLSNRFNNSGFSYSTPQHSSTGRGNSNSTPGAKFAASLRNSGRGKFNDHQDRSSNDYSNSTPGARFAASLRNSGRGNFNDHQDRSSNNFSTPNHRFNQNSRGGFNKSNHRDPISSIPVDKFVSNNMVEDPWAEFYDQCDSGIHVEESIPTISSLEDSEIIIDSDTSAIGLVENSFDDVLSDNEIDCSSVHDTGSDSPNVATSSTSEKDTGTDSGSDA